MDSVSVPVPSGSRSPPLQLVPWPPNHPRRHRCAFVHTPVFPAQPVSSECNINMFTPAPIPHSTLSTSLPRPVSSQSQNSEHSTRALYSIDRQGLTSILDTRVALRCPASPPLHSSRVSWGGVFGQLAAAAHHFQVQVHFTVRVRVLVLVLVFWGSSSCVTHIYTHTSSRVAICLLGGFGFVPT